jgi:hypothetical protein
MQITTKYDLGEIVFPISIRTETIYNPRNCSLCKDAGKIELNNKYYTCPECKNTPNTIIAGKTEYYVQCDQEYKICKIGLAVVDKAFEGENQTQYCLNYKNTPQKTGWVEKDGRNINWVDYDPLKTLWQEEDIFRTIEEAQAECDKRNKDKEI